MTDKELLELAAKAAGYLNWTATPHTSGLHIETGSCRGARGFYWNPLTDDGAALRLAVKLNLIVGAYGSYTSVFQTSAPTPNEEIVCWYGSYNIDPYAATRRAIVRAAAEIGKSMGDKHD